MKYKFKIVIINFFLCFVFDMFFIVNNSFKYTIQNIYIFFYKMLKMISFISMNEMIN